MPVSPPLIEAAMLPGTNRKLVLAVARTDPGNADYVIHSMRCILSKPGGGEDKSVTRLADTVGDPPSSDAASISSGNSGPDVRQVYLT